jgi:hypothetical protein
MPGKLLIAIRGSWFLGGRGDSRRVGLNITLCH